MPKPILIIGGTGVFGKRLVRHLATRAGIALFVSSRDAARAEAFIQTLQGSIAPLHAVGLSCQENLQRRLDDIRPFIVIDCSGPFQGANYDTARTVLRSGAHLVDLADARDYLAGFAGALDDVARDHDVTALTGASSTPTLSTCVARHLTRGWTRVDTIDICITPGGKSEVGRSVIEAIMSYAGRDIPIWRSGRLSKTIGWNNARMIDIPGLGRRRVAAVETFDAEHLGPSLNVQSRVAFFAGLESAIEQRGIEAVAALRKRGLTVDLGFLIPLLLKARKLTRLATSDVGGMLVDICGLDENGVWCRARWSLIARQDYGPFIPILPAAAAVEKLMAGAVSTGARPAHRALDVSDILEHMRPYAITTQTSVTRTDKGVFETALGTSSFKSLPKAVRTFHDPSGPVVWHGVADIKGGAWFAPRILARVFGFPGQGRDVPVTVTLERTTSPDGTPVETWIRNFAGTRLISVLKTDGKGNLTERFAPFTFVIPVRADADGLDIPVSGWRIGWLKLPKFLAPQSTASEYVDKQGRFCFDVHLSAPLFGTIAHYKGWLGPITGPGR